MPQEQTPTYRGSTDQLTPGLWPVLRASQGVPTTVRLVLPAPADGSSALADFSSGVGMDTEVTITASPVPAHLLVRETASGPILFDIAGVAVAPRQFTFTLEATHVVRAGIFLADVTTPGGPLIAPGVTRCFLEVQPTSLDGVGSDMLSIAELRLAMRDQTPQANYLLDDVEFTDAEIIYAMRRPIDLWNETPPDVIRYAPSNFPYRYHWTNSVIGHLLIQASFHKLRNHLSYSGGGVAVDDSSRWTAYAQLGRGMVEEYKNWVLLKKVEINVAHAFGYSG